MDFSIARQHFYQTVHQPDDQVCLERAALYLAAEEYPDLDVEAYLNALDMMAMEVKEQLPAEPYPLRILQTINRYLYDDLGYQGNTTHYYDPSNSFLNDVMDRRTGIPITLSLVYLAIANRIDFPMVGVGMPGHFLVRPAVDDMEIFVDPFNRGEIMFQQDCQDRLNEIFGQPVQFLPAFLPTFTSRQFLVRMLTNLKGIYINRGDLPKAVASVERILILVPDAALELRDRGVLYYHLNRMTEARRDLEDYLVMSPAAEDAIVIQELLETMNGE